MEGVMAGQEDSKRGRFLRRVGMFFSVPWCCVSLVVASFTAGFGITIGFVFDSWFHRLIPFLIAIHGYNLFRYARQPHKTVRQTLTIAIMTVIFILCILFHLTDLHDVLFDGLNDH